MSSSCYCNVNFMSISCQIHVKIMSLSRQQVHVTIMSSSHCYHAMIMSQSHRYVITIVYAFCTSKYSCIFFYSCKMLKPWLKLIADLMKKKKKKKRLICRSSTLPHGVVCCYDNQDGWCHHGSSNT